MTTQITRDCPVSCVIDEKQAILGLRCRELWAMHLVQDVMRKSLQTRDIRFAPSVTQTRSPETATGVTRRVQNQTVEIFRLVVLVIRWNVTLAPRSQHARFVLVSVTQNMIDPKA
jgi:hypothetical protein